MIIVLIIGRIAAEAGLVDTQMGGNSSNSNRSAPSDENGGHSFEV